MLVSSHTVSIWQRWSFVPEHIQQMFVEKADSDLIIFVPRVVENGEGLPEFLKLLNVGEGKQTSTGTAYVAKGAINTDRIPRSFIEVKDVG